MYTTLLAIGVSCALFAIETVARAFFLWLGARWVKIPAATFRRAVLVTLLTVLAELILLWLLSQIPVTGEEPTIGVDCLGFVLQLALAWLIVAHLFRARIGRAIVAWLPTLIPAACSVAFIFLVFRPYMFQSHLIPTNAMAPTLVGQHREAECPRCGAPAFGGPMDEFERRDPKPVPMICSKELRSVEVMNPPQRTYPGDRILENKMLHPRRWDLVTFRLPENPEVKYVMRVVGFPNEQVVIRDGAVWIDGQKLAPPDACQGLEYLDQIDHWRGTLWGGQSHPARLAADEYFVLGDFSARSSDSRLWQQGAPGHPPYAVPASYIDGVVTHIFWPICRWRVLR